MEDTSARQLLNIKLKGGLKTWVAQVESKDLGNSAKYSRKSFNLTTK